MTLGPLELSVIAGLGLLAGVLGGMLGIGGSVVMIPGLVILFHSKDPESQHLYQAAAMAVNVAVAAPAAIRHARRGTVRRDLFIILMPAALIAIVVGVLLSDHIPATTLRRLFAIFLLYIVVMEILKIFRRLPDAPLDGVRVTVPRAGAVGGAMGLVAGLLGVGGGVLAVPLAQRLCRLPMRHAIGASSAAMCITAIAGASVKITTLPQHGYDRLTAITLAMALAPTAILGAALGASLTHRLPLVWIRAALVALLLIAAWRMSGLPLW